jgi:hypothetical protein
MFSNLNDSRSWPIRDPPCHGRTGHRNFPLPLPSHQCNNGGPWIAFIIGCPKNTEMQVKVMWLEKLLNGVLRVYTPLGPRLVKPSLVQRVYLLWIFRNFPTLPVAVLSRSQQRRIERMCRKHGFFSHFARVGWEEFAILGTLEQRPQPQENSLFRAGRVEIEDNVPSFIADARRQS